MKCERFSSSETHGKIKFGFPEIVFKFAKKPFEVGTKGWLALLALALVCMFYLRRCLITGVRKRYRVGLVSYVIFNFNKVCSCIILMCVSLACHKVLPPWPRDSLP